MDLVSYLVAFGAGMGAGWLLKVRVDVRNSGRSNKVTQQNNQAGGDIVGGDKTSNDK